MSTADNRPGYAPPITNAQCKVCTSPERFQIEVALAQGQPQQHIAQRFSRDGYLFNKQNINTHYHRHMPVIDKAVAEVAAAQNRGIILDLETATAIGLEHARNRARLRAQVSRISENGELNWRPRDVIAFMEFDVRLAQEQAEARAGLMFQWSKALGEAVLRAIPDWETRGKIADAYDEIVAERGLTDEARFLYDGDEDSGDTPS